MTSDASTVHGRVNLSCGLRDSIQRDHSLVAVSSVKLLLYAITEHARLHDGLWNIEGEDGHAEREAYRELYRTVRSWLQETEEVV
jgi:hypothetical protein